MSWSARRHRHRFRLRAKSGASRRPEDRPEGRRDRQGRDGRQRRPAPRPRPNYSRVRAGASRARGTSGGTVRDRRRRRIRGRTPALAWTPPPARWTRAGRCRSSSRLRPGRYGSCGGNLPGSGRRGSASRRTPGVCASAGTRARAKPLLRPRIGKPPRIAGNRPQPGEPRRAGTSRIRAPR